MSELKDNLEDCEDLIDDPYSARTTTVARAKLCGSCQYFTIENTLMPSMRCALKLRPHIETSGIEFLAICASFVSKKS